MAKGTRCNCNAGFLIAALALFSVGAYFLVAAFGLQLKGDGAVAVLPWYFAGFAAIALGKMAKWKSHVACQVHKIW